LHVTFEEVTQVLAGNFRRDAKEVFVMITTAAQIVSGVRTVEIKLTIHVPHHLIERSLPFRLAANQQIQNDTDDFAFRVVTDRGVRKIGLLRVRRVVDVRRRQRRVFSAHQFAAG